MWTKKAWPPRSLLAHDRPLDDLLVVLADVRLDGSAPLGRRLDHGDVADAGQRHLQRARDRRGAHGDDVDAQLELAQQLLLLDAEALLLVEDQEAEVLGAHVATEHAVGPDEDVGPAFVEPRDRFTLLGGAAEAADVVDGEGVVLQPLGERPVVLLGEDGRGREEEDLLAVGRRLERRAQRDLGLPVADVAADEPVHRPSALPCRS